MSACALLAAGLLLAAADPQVVVVVQGEGRDAGKAQLEIDNAFLARSVAVRLGSTISTTVGAPEPPPTPAPSAIAAAEVALTSAVELFLQGEFQRAKEDAIRAKTVLAGAPDAGHETRVRAFLWSAILSQQSGDQPGAEREVAELLDTVDPAPKVGAEFPPDFKAYVENEARKRAPLRLTLSETPNNVQVYLNGRKGEGNSILVSAAMREKAQRLSARATGFRPIDVSIVLSQQGTGPWTLPLPMALQPKPDADRAIRAMLDGKTPEATPIQTLTAGARATELVAVRVSGTSRSAVLWRDGKVYPLSGSTGAEIVASALDRIDPSLAAKSSFVTGGGLVVSSWNRSLEGIYDLPMTGTGPRLTADGAWKGFLLSADVSYVSYLSTIEANIEQPGSPTKTKAGPGGDALRASAGLGYGLALGEALEIGVLGGYRMEQFTRETVTADVSGEPRVLLTGHSWAGPEARLRAIWTRGDLRVTGSGGAAFATTYSERQRASGSDPAVDPVPFWSVGATYDYRGMALGLQYAGMVRSVQFSGDAEVPQVGKDTTDLRLSETLNEITLTAAYRFGATTSR